MAWKLFRVKTSKQEFSSLLQKNCKLGEGICINDSELEFTISNNSCEFIKNINYPKEQQAKYRNWYLEERIAWNVYKPYKILKYK